MKRNVDRRIKRTKDTLKDAFIELLKEKDYEEITVNELLERANYSKPTFYNHFSNKKDFIHSIMDDEIENFNELITCFFKNHISDLLSENEVIKFNEMRFNYIYKHRDIYEVLFTEKCFNEFPGKLRQYFDNLTLPSLNPLFGVKERSRKYYSFIIAHIFVGTIEFWVKDNFMYSPSHMTDLYTHTFYFLKPTQYHLDE